MDNDKKNSKISYHPTHILGKNPDDLKSQFLESCKDISSFNANMFNRIRGVPTYDEDLNMDYLYKIVSEMRERYSTLKTALKHRGEDIPKHISDCYEESEKIVSDIYLIEPQ